MGILVSVVIATYNQERYIRQALDSVISQKVNFILEVLVADDASIDNTLQILKDYAEAHPEVKLVLREKNIGATENVYHAMNECSGKYLAYLEGDDYWTDSGKLQKQVDFLESNTKFVGCCHKFNIVDGCGNIIKRKLSWVKHKEVFTLSDFRGIYLPSQPSTFVFRNFFLDKERDYSFLYKTDKMIGDRTHMLFCLSMGSFYCLEQVMGVYRITYNSLTFQLYGIIGAIERDLVLTQKLESLANELKVNVDFSYHRKELYTSAILRFIKTFGKSGIQPLRNIRAGRSRLLFLIYLPLGIWRRVARLWHQRAWE